MPRKRVLDSRTGRTHTIDWNLSRPPTRAELDDLIRVDTGVPPPIPTTRAEPVPSPMPKPQGINFRKFFQRDTGSIADRFATSIDTLYGGERAALPQIKGINSPILPELPEDRGTTLDRFAYEGIRGSSSLLGLAADTVGGGLAAKAFKGARGFLRGARGVKTPSISPVAQQAPVASPISAAAPVSPLQQFNARHLPSVYQGGGKPPGKVVSSKLPKQPRPKKVRVDPVEAFERWVGKRQAAPVRGKLVSNVFTKLDEAPDVIKRFESGANDPDIAPLRQYFERRFQDIAKSGLKIGHRENYITHVWKEDPTKVKETFRRLGITPSFAKERVFESYEAGIKAGLTPKFKKITDIVHTYEQTFQKNLADRTFFTQGKQSGWIKPASKAPSDWAHIDTKHAPLAFQGKAYAAPKEIASKINNYLRPTGEAFGLGGKINKAGAAVNRLAKNVVLSSGIPFTGLTFHGYGVAARRSFAKGGAATYVKSMVDLATPWRSAKYLDNNIGSIAKAVDNGLTLGSEGFRAFDPAAREATTAVSKVIKTVGDARHQMFEVPMFEKVIPAWKHKHYNSLVKSGVDGKNAAKMTNEIFGGINWEMMGRNRDFQDLLQNIVLAPDWLESTGRLGKGIATKLLTNTPEGKQYRQIVGNAMQLYALANVMNYMKSGHLMIENDPGHQFQIETRSITGPEGETRKEHINLPGTGADFYRIPYEVVESVARRGWTEGLNSATRALGNRAAMLSKTIHSLWTNQDWKGDPLYGRTKYGEDIPTPEGISNVGATVADMAVPQFGRAAYDYARGKVGPEQAITKGLEIPVTYTRPRGLFQVYGRRDSDSRSRSRSRRRRSR